MGLITKTKTWSDNENVEYTDMNSNFDTLYSLVNGNIDNDNIKPDAGISASKISFGTSVFIRSVLSLATAEISTGTQKDEFTIPDTVPSGKWLIEAIELEVDKAPGTGKTLTVDVNKNGASILSSTISISGTTKRSKGNTPSDQTLSANDLMTIDIDTATSGLATTRCRVNLVIKQYLQK